ncbi:Predicted lipid-binding transport protein, Tim44 family [Nitrosomonas eutropha]|uniref:Predicted lipid-binding transport protein, Tim44 family n=1 Tax=Nitrosomonas eutropha TaxID=916 RepID=A0A1I7HP75_9PROT|nr:Tim44-like domain-containing protein [Nitrosomonas eutropha]SFU62512.1 Predicted lipid-binding transport protein, Tim44 family [Nitrosomonas eutropha]
MRILTFLALALLAFSLTALDAEARRMGGGSSLGKQRQSLNLNRQQQQTAPQQAQRPGQSATPAAATGASKWLGPLAGLAAGGLLASLLMGGAFDGINMMDILILAGIAAAIFFGIRMMRRSSGGGQAARPMQYSGAGAGHGMGGMPFPRQDAATPSGGAASGGSGQSANADALDIPAGFDVDSFLKNAKGSFITLQLAHDSGDLEEIRAFTTPELFAEISKQITERGNATQQTDVTHVNAALLDITTQDNHAVASVRFTGELREAPGAQLETFDEIWHVEKDLVASDSAWLLSGIQQASDLKH